MNTTIFTCKRSTEYNVLNVLNPGIVNTTN